MLINILTLFPNFFTGPLSESILNKAQDKNLVKINVLNIRDFAQDKHHLTDDRPFGGGPGMVMKIEPIHEALKSLEVEKGQANSQIILTSAKGKVFSQPLAVDYAKLKQLTIICGHYEGVDERVKEHLIDAEVRIGDYVLTGGEGAAYIMTDAITRLIPGVLGNELSNQDESHSTPGQLGFPQYTRPEVYRSWSVPSVLLSGDHTAIKAWREQNRSK